jgi:hypothetical protein
MGIKLDWQVESEQTSLRATEDPEARRRRHRARVRLLLVIVVLAGTALSVIGAILWRLKSVDDQYRQDLLDTVEIEVTALRLGDYANFMALQRSASDAFLLEQSREFKEYQALKQVHRVDLTGDVRDVTIDGLRGRVVVEELIDGVPYHVVWYYWYYKDGGQNNQAGWRRVPDDLTFWGDEHKNTTNTTLVTYHDLDQELAQALAPLAENWWRRGCDLLQCANLPTLHIDIVAERPNAVEWSDSDPWTLRVTSPLVGRMRADKPIPIDLQLGIINQLAQRLALHVANNTPPLIHADAAWLQQEAAAWLSLVLSEGDGTKPGFMGSLAGLYGPTAPGAMLRVSRPDSTLDAMLPAVTGASLAALSLDQLNALDWRSYFQWRLELEKRLLAQPDSSGMFLALYDLENLSTANEASNRLENPSYAALSAPQVGTVSIRQDENTYFYAYVETTRTDNNQSTSETIIWRLIGGTWKRVN